MPGGDRTGPTGAGPRTGRAAGFCAGYGMPGYMNPGVGGYGAYGGGRGYGRGMGMGRGFGGGRGGGRGWRNMYYATGQPGWARGGYSPPEYYAEPYPEAPTSRTRRQTRRDELAYLKDEAAHLKGTLDDINSRIAELEKNNNGQ